MSMREKVLRSLGTVDMHHHLAYTTTFLTPAGLFGGIDPSLGIPLNQSIQPTHQQPEADDEISDDSEDGWVCYFGPSRFDWVSTQYVYMCI